MKYVWLFSFQNEFQRDHVTSMQLIQSDQPGLAVGAGALLALAARHGLAPGSPAREPRLFWSWAVVAVVFSPAGINYWLSVSRIFQMGCFLWNPKGESRSLGSGGREGRKLAKETVWKGCFPVSPNQVQNNKLSQSTFYLLTVRFSRPGQESVRRAAFATWLQQICLPDQSRG